MPRAKRSVSLPPELESAVIAHAEQQGVSFSAWLADAAWQKLEAEDKYRAAMAAIAEFEAENGPISESEREEARAALRAAGVLAPEEAARKAS